MFTYIDTYIYIYTYIHIYVYVYIHVYMQRTHMYIYIYICILHVDEGLRRLLGRAPALCQLLRRKQTHILLKKVTHN